MALVSLSSRTDASASLDGRRAGSRAGARPMRVVDPDARARLEALAPKLAATVAGIGAGDVGGVMAAERVVPVDPVLAGVMPHGLVQGSTVTCTGGAATSLALLLVAEASRRGAWVGVAGLPGLGVQAAGEAGVDVERIVAVRDRPAPRAHGRVEHERRLGVPGAGYDDGTWGQVLAAMIDGFDLVLIGPGVQVRAGTARRVQARAQARGAVLVLAGEVAGFGADVHLRADARWECLGDGHGHLRSRRVTVQAHGRRVPRPRRDELWFPAADGRITSARTVAAAVPVPVDETVTPTAPTATTATTVPGVPGVPGVPVVLERTG